MDADRVFYNDMKFENFTYEELSFLKKLASQELSILTIYDRLVEYDCNNPVSDEEDTDNIEKAKQYFPYYKDALQGIDELIDRHIAVFEKEYEEIQAVEKTKKNAENKARQEKIEKEKKEREAKQKAKEEKKNGIVNLFDNANSEKEATDLVLEECCLIDEDYLTQEHLEEQLQKDSDFND